jgi:hypothetical protein
MYVNPAFIAQILEIIGASIYLILGIFHGVLTLQDLSNPRTFTPPEKALRLAMQNSSIAIHPQTNLWRAWLGFNLSHSLGLLIFGSVFVVIGLFYFLTFAQTLWLQCSAILISTAYLIMSIKFWFYKPVIASGLGLTCFVIAAGLSLKYLSLPLQ